LRLTSPLDRRTFRVGRGPASQIGSQRQSRWRVTQPTQRRAHCDDRINHLLFEKKDYANLIETFWRPRFQPAEMLEQAELAAKVARRDTCWEALKIFRGGAIDERISS
jgi:hypothetical protein